MSSRKLERFSLAAIADALNGSDVATARDSLSQLVGAVVEVSGTVQKRVRREGECKLVIEPGADNDRENRERTETAQTTEKERVRGKI
jgi:hypothetical protein